MKDGDVILAEIKGKIHVITDRDNNNAPIYKVLHPQTESAQITDFATATDLRIDNKLSAFFSGTLEDTYLHLNANATSATKLETARTINIADASSTHTGTGASFDGTNNVVIKLPGTIKADVIGNASTATILQNSRDINISDADSSHTGTAISFNGSSSGTIKLPSTIKATLEGNASTATTLQTGRDINIADHDITNTGVVTNFDGSQNITIKLPSTIKASLTGNATSATKLANKKTIAISGGATGTATEFDGSDNISIPVTSLDASKLTGTASVDTTGNADTATTLKSSRTIKIADASNSNIGTGTSFNGSTAVTLNLPGTIEATLIGNADTATKLASKKLINITDASSTHTGTGINFDGSAAGTITLPATITATLDGNAATATKATGDSAGNNIISTYAPKISPALSGTPTAPTAALGTATTQIATTQFVNNAISNLVGAAPETLDTLAEIANAINNDQNIYDTLDNAISNKQDKHAALTSISGLSTAANQMIYTTASNTYATTSLTELARNLLDDTTASNMRSTIDALGKSEKAVSAISADTAAECTGNANTATTLKTARSINIADASSTNVGTAFSFDGSSAGIIKLPGTIKANLTGNADTATKLANKRSINIADADESHTGTAISFDGSNTTVLNIKLPSTIKATLEGNASTATNATNDSSGNNIISTYETKTNAITGLSISDKTITYTKGSGSTGTITTADKRVTQTATTTNTTYPILLSATANRTSTATEEARFGSEVKVNPSTSTIYASKFNGNLEGTADSAYQDGLGNNIATTYETKANAITGLSISDKTITYTKGDGNTGTISTQDKRVTQTVKNDNATYPVLAAATANLTSTVTSTTVFGTGVKINPSTSTIYAANFTGLASKTTGDESGNNIISTYETKTNAITGLSISGKVITYTKGNGVSNTLTTQDTTYMNVTDSTHGLMSKEDKAKLDTIAENADNVTFTQSLASGTKVGEIVINGATTILYCTANNAVSFTSDTSTTTYPLLFKNTTGTTTTAGGVRFNSNIYVTPSTGTITATNFNGLANKATADESGNNIISTYETKTNAITGLSVSGRVITYTKGSGASNTLTTQDTTYADVTTSTHGLMTAADKVKLNTIAESADNVTFTQSLTSGTEVGKIVINGATTTLFCQTNTDTDTKVTQTVTSDNNTYPILFSATANRTATATEAARFASAIKINPSTNTIYATNFSGNLIGTPTAPTAALGTNTTQIATTQFVNNAISNLVGTAPETLDTLAEIATAINNDQSVYTTLNNAITNKQDKHAALTSISGLTTAADKMIYTTAANTYAVTTLTSTARTLLDDADVTTMQATLNVPTRTGGNASGTWGINISGTASTAVNDSNGKKISEHTIEYIVGTQTTATGAWTGVTKDAALYAGKIIVYKLPYAGSGAASLNLTLSTGATTGAKNIYRYASTRLSTQYAANYYVPLIYNGTYWFAFADYDSTIYDRIRSANAITTASGDIAAYRFIGSTDGHSYKELGSSITFDIRYPVLYNITATAAGGNMSTGIYWISQSQNMKNILNNTEITFDDKSPVFIKGTLSGNIFTVHSDVLTTTVPTSADGYTYLYVGRTYSTYQMNVNVLYNQLWQYINGSFQPFNPATIKALQDIKGQQIDSTYIKNITASGTTVTFTRGDNTTGTFTTQDTNTNTDTNVTQTNNTNNTAYPILLKNGTGTGTITNSALFASGITVNPSTSTITATNFAGKAISAGTADSATTAGSCTGNAATATKATQDSSGNNIISTYIKNITASGTTVTFTRGDNTTGTFTTQDTDTNTHYSAYIRAGAASGTANAATGNGSTYINLVENSAYRSGVKLIGSGNTTVTSDSSGNITINSTSGSYNEATTSASGLMSADDKTKLNGIQSGATAVSFTQTKTSGTELGKIVINGATTVLYYTDTDTNTHNNCVSFTSDTSATTYPLLFKNTTGSTTTAAGTRFNTGIYVQPSTGTITATNFAGKATSAGTADSATTAGSCTGNAATATKATQDSSGNNIVSTYIKNITASGTTVTFTRGDNTTGTFTTQDTNTNTDTLVTQNVSTTNTTYPILASVTADATTNQGAKTAIFGSGIKINPSTSTVYATTFSGNLTGNVTGNVSGSAGSCTGNAATATKATQDASGNTITTTYATKSELSSYLPIAGGTITGNLRLKGSGNYGNKLNFGDGDYIYFHEASDDVLTIYAKTLIMNTVNGTTFNQTLSAPTASAGTSTTQVATTAFVQNAVAGVNSGSTVSFTRSLSSGTAIGTIVINGTSTVLYCQTNTDTDTHHTAYIRAGAASGTANAATGNGSTYINLVENSTYRSGVKLIGSGATTVTSDANGNITINSTDTNTNTDTNVTQTNNTNNTAYPILLKNGTGTGTVTSGALFASGITVNPSTSTITATNFAGKATSAGTADSATSASTATTASAGTSTTAIATTAFVQNAIAGVNAGSTVSFTRSLSSGTAIGTIVINGTSTVLYCQTNTDTDTKVSFTSDTSATTYPLLFKNTTGSTTTAAGTRFNTGIYVQPSTGTITATNFAGKATSAGTADSATTAGSCTGNAATATKATQDSSGNNIVSTYIKNITASGTTVTFTRGDNTTGTFTTQDTNTNTDTNVTQTVTTTATTYPILLSATANRTATATEGARFASAVKVHTGLGVVLGTFEYTTSNVSVTSNTTTSATASNAWYTTNTTAGTGITYARRYRISNASIIANDTVDVDIVSNIAYARGAGLASFTETFAGGFYLYANATPGAAFNIRYRIFHYKV